MRSGAAPRRGSGLCTFLTPHCGPRMLSSGRSLAELFARRAFTIGTREYLWLDVVLAAMLRGDWAPFEAALREGLACASYAEATGEDAGEAADESAQRVPLRARPDHGGGGGSLAPGRGPDRRGAERVLRAPGAAARGGAQTCPRSWRRIPSRRAISPTRWRARASARARSSALRLPSRAARPCSSAS